MDTWADINDVKRYTDYEPTESEVYRAQDIVELFAGTTYAAAEISQGNLRRLQKAVAYQTAWMSAHPDIYTNVDVDNVSADGQSHTPSHVNAALLAPLALRHISRLTWKLKPLRVRKRYGTSDYGDDGPRDSAAADDNRTWTPMR